MAPVDRDASTVPLQSDSSTNLRPRDDEMTHALRNSSPGASVSPEATGPPIATMGAQNFHGTLLPRLSPSVDAALFDDFRSSPRATPLPCTDDDIATLTQQRLSAVALRLAAAGRLQLTALQVASLRAATFATTALSLAIINASRQGLDALCAGGIPFAISKGPGLALAGYHPSERPFLDLDLLVPPRHFRHAFAILASLGYEEAMDSRPPWAWYNLTCREAVNLRSPGGGSLDLHHHVPPWLWSRAFDLSSIVTAAHATSLYGYPLPVVQPADNLLIVSLHIVSDHNKPGATLMAWRDLLMMARICDADDVLALAARYRLTGWLRWIIAQLPPDVRPAALSLSLTACSSRPPHHLRLSLLTPPALGSRHMIGQAFRLPFSNAVRYLIGMAFPSPRFLAEHFPGTPRRYFHWWATSLRRMAHSARTETT